MTPLLIGLALTHLLPGIGGAVDGPAASGWAEIRVVDAASGRGVPLVELETVNSLKFVTDSAGRIAFNEPGLVGREIFFFVRSHGYDAPRDGFGFAGIRVTPRVGTPVEIRITRRNIAERLCRLTGEGIFRDSLLLGQTPAIAKSPPPGGVAGQDSIQAAVYRGRVYCFWGDTQRMEHPLGLFRMAGATMALPDAKFDPASGIVYDYFTDAKSGFARAMMPLAERPEGVVWIHALAVVPDEKGVERLVGHYSRRKSLAEEVEQGIAVFNDEKAVFEAAKPLPLTETWRHPSGHPILYEDGGVKWLLFGSPSPNVRVPATLAALLDPSKYEAFTCNRDAKLREPDFAMDGTPNWRWQKTLPPVDSGTEAKWIQSKKLRPDQARFCPADASSLSDRITLHRGTLRWNDFRKQWVLIAGQVGGKPSWLGEVWYAEADSPTGPFAKAVKVLTHDRQSFYNPCHHAFMDRDGGRTIHFEGTYTSDFSGSLEKTPRYNYNQLLYRLDLSSAALKPVQTK